MTGGWGTPLTGRAETPDVGETFVAGKDPDTAQALLAACRELDLPTLLVRTSTKGFIVPNAVYDLYADQQPASAHGI